MINFGKMTEENKWDMCKDIIRSSYDGNYDCEDFHEAIWQVSVDFLEGKEVSVIVDRENKLFISKGTASFVDYKKESVAGLKIPMRCWLHTHPFGTAYFSNTDWGTINSQEHILKSAIVLGDMERMKWWKIENKQFLSKTNLMSLDDSEE
tara:strand:+ start:1264 stop:1713 length:450 start_codon:yes stop_codon:yes gene_type:complete